MSLKNRIITYMLGYDPAVKDVRIVEKIEIVPEGTMMKLPVFCLQTPAIERTYYCHKDVAYTLDLHEALAWRNKNPDRRQVRVTEGYVRDGRWYNPVAQEGLPLADMKTLLE